MNRYWIAFAFLISMMASPSAQSRLATESLLQRAKTIVKGQALSAHSREDCRKSRVRGPRWVRAKVRIELDPTEHQYRVVVSSSHEVEFDQRQLEVPEAALRAPAVLVWFKIKNGEMASCDCDDFPLPSDATFLKSSAPGPMIVHVGPGRPFATPWRDIAVLARHSAQQTELGPYEGFSISVNLDSSDGRLHTSTEWFDMSRVGVPSAEFSEN